MSARSSLSRYMRLYALYVKLYVQSGLVYHLETYVKLTTRALGVAASLAFIALLYTRIETLNGWSKHELYLLAGYGGVVVSLHDLLLDTVYDLGQQYVTTGDFDRFLVRPASPLFQLYADDFSDEKLLDVVLNASVVVYAAANVDSLVLTPGTVLYGLVLLPGGVFAIGALYLIAATTVFWTGRAKGLFWMLTDALEFRKYPISIYPRLLKTILWTVLPIAATIFVPVTVLVGAPRWTLAQGVALFVGPVAYFVAYQVWKQGVRRYSSTGS